MDRSARITGFVETIWQWYRQQKRELPWRDLPDPDPAVRAYKVMVSEIMLQQTQVNRVKIVFKYFLERFPKISDLAQASNRDVLMAWRGMGYNSRALRLRDAAGIIFNPLPLVVRPRRTKWGQFSILNFPSSLEELLQIPGIGPYTAAAIRNFAFNLPTPCLDTNIRRIVHRTFIGPEHPDGTWKKDDDYLLALAAEILDIAIGGMRNAPACRTGRECAHLPDGQGIRNISCDAANWHAALMDFGSMIQTKRNPRWDICPLTRRGIMKTTPKMFHSIPNPISRSQTPSPEPGRMVGSRYIPNRIFRGKVIEELRDAKGGLTLHDIGKRVCIDWSPRAHRQWLEGITKKLMQERMLQVLKGRYRLFEG